MHAVPSMIAKSSCCLFHDKGWAELAERKCQKGYFTSLLKFIFCCLYLAAIILNGISLSFDDLDDKSYVHVSKSV